jgi:hypothetical protein
MTITISKGKLVRWIIAAVILFCGPSQAVDVPRAAIAVVANREFMAGFAGYGDYRLLDVYEWRPGFFGVMMLCPAGIHETLVFDCRDGKREIIYRDAYIPRKEKREELRRESILVSDAVKLAAKTAVCRVSFQDNGQKLR